MTRILPIAVVNLVSACRHDSSAANSAMAARIRACQAQTLTVYPWAYEGALVEESQYQHLVKQVADELALNAPDRIIELRKFASVSQGTTCTSGLRLEGRVVSLIHKSRQFHYKVAGRLVDCTNEQPVGRFEVVESNKDISSMAAALADTVARELDDDDICAWLAGQPNE